MTEPDDLANQLSELIDDSARPVVFSEITARASDLTATAPSVARRRNLRLVVVAAVCVVLVAATVTIVVESRRTTASTARTGPPRVTVPGSTTSLGSTSTTTATANADPVASLPKLPAPAIRTYHFGPDLQIEQAVPVNGALWLVGYRSRCHVSPCPSLFRLDEATGAVTPLAASSAAGGIGVAQGDGAIWFLSDRVNGSPYAVTRVNAATGAVDFTVPVPNTHVFGNTNPLGRIAVGFGSVWVYEGNNFVARLNEINGEQTARVGLPGGLGANGLAVNSFGVWAVAYGDTEVMRIDPDTNTAAVVKRFPVGFSQSISADPTSVWVTHALDAPGGLVRIDAANPSVSENAHIPTFAVSAAGGRVWFFGWEPGAQAASPRNHPGLVGQVDPTTLKVTGVTELPAIDPDDDTSFVADGADAWVIDSTSDTLWRIAGR